LYELKIICECDKKKALDPDSIDGGIVRYAIAPPTYVQRDPKIGQ